MTPIFAATRCWRYVSVAATSLPSRQENVRRGQQFELFTIVYNSAEGLISILAGLVAGSVSLSGFGLDSLIEVTSGTALLWRLRHDIKQSMREQVERTTLRIVGGYFLALALYILYESPSAVVRHEVPNRSIPGIIVAAVSVVAMPLLSRAKRRIAIGIGSAAMMGADARQADFCTYLSAILLGGLLLNALLGWWWADPLAGLAMVPIIAKEAVDSLKGKACGCSDNCHPAALSS